jgi:hypothetical protein
MADSVGAGGVFGYEPRGRTKAGRVQRGARVKPMERIRERAHAAR